MAYSVLLSMPRRKKPRPYARIAITLPPDVLEAADRLAARLDRSRSWVVAEAVRRYETAPVDQAEVIAAGRRELLRAALGLSPEERLLRAEELVELARLVHPRPPRAQIIGFDSEDDFAAWKASSRLRP